MTWVQRCDEGDMDTVTGVCAAPYWAPDSGFLPPLEVSESLLICAAIGGTWALGFAIRQILKATEILK